MPLATIKSGSDCLPAGTYNAKFVSVEECLTNGKEGKAWKWTFKTKDGNTIIGFSDIPPRTPKNKVSKWLSCLSKKPLKEDLSINTDDYIDKEYLLILVPNGEKTKLEMFSALWA
jgi:hypothetical protein